MPFFFVIDDRVYLLVYLHRSSSRACSRSTRTARSTARRAKQVYSFTHFDIWAYGTNFFTISLYKSGHNDPAAPCINAGISSGTSCRRPAPAPPKSTACSVRPSASTKSSIPRPSPWGRCSNVSFEVGMDANTENRYFGAPSVTSSPVCSLHSTCLTRATSTSRPGLLGVRQSQFLQPSAAAASPVQSRA